MKPYIYKITICLYSIYNIYTVIKITLGTTYWKYFSTNNSKDKFISFFWYKNYKNKTTVPT